MGAQSIEELNNRFAIAGVVKFEPGEGGLTRAVVTSPAAEGHVYLHGAHVTHYQPRGGKPVLMLSPRSAFEDGKPIRGGVPVIFPWFGPHKTDPSLPMHGKVRLKEWTFESATRKGGDAIELIFSTDAENAKLRLIATIGPMLEIALEVTNTSGGELKFEEALHTYFAVADIRTISIHGLKGTTYKDKTQDFREVREEADAIGFTDHMDRVYQNTKATCTIDDPGNRRTFVVAKENSDTTVVWNPWQASAGRMADLGEDQWTRFVCVETANVGDSAVTLAAGATHSMRAKISVRTS